MPTPINYAVQYGRELANAYPYLSYFPELWANPNGNQYRPVNAKTIMIPSMSTTGARAVNRDQINGVINRNFDIGWEPKVMTMYREWDTIIDPMDVVETDEVATIANVTRTFNQFQKIPEMDAYAASHLASFAGDFGHVSTTAITSDNVLAQWDAALEAMAEGRVQRSGIYAKVTPAVYKALKEAAGLTRFVDIGGGASGVDRNIGKLDGVTIREVPSDMMQSAYDFTVGFAPAASANQINMILYDPMAAVAPIVYETSMTTPPSAATKGKTVYYEAYYYDVFPLLQRNAGFYANVGSAPSLGALAVTSVAGEDAGDTIITYTGSMINEHGKPFDGCQVYYVAGTDAAVSLTYGSALPSGQTWTKCSGHNPLALTSQTANKYITIAVVNRSGVVIAGGNAQMTVGA